MSAKQLEDINNRLEKLEKQDFQDVLTLLEIVSNATFFGEIKKTNCEYSKEGQCSFFFLKKEAKTRLPLATDCRIKNCNDSPNHCHMELSNLTCSLCPLWRNTQNLENHTAQETNEGKITCLEK